MAATESAAPLLVVADAGPLIHLDELDSLDLLAGFPNVLAPYDARAKVARLPHAALGAKGIANEFAASTPTDAALAALCNALWLHRRGGARPVAHFAAHHAAHC